ncbi:MAG: patatin-like phospholipase family protein, partial [Frankiales bacterium]|nr:patatin-like phospholipase family protein [Frankiales bacterium]
GLDVTEADLVIGTSAGATTAAQVTSATPSGLLAAILGAEPAPIRPSRSGGGPPPAGSVAEHLDRTSHIIAASTGPADMRRRMGAAALELEATSDSDWSTRWRATVALRLPSPAWPETTVRLVAVDARTGAPVVFDRHSGVDLVDAVAASTSSSLPYRIGDERYLDGGYRRNENADLAVGYERVLVLSPFGGRTRHPSAWGMQLEAQVEELRDAGSRVEAIFPDADALQAFGENMMDLSRRAPAVRAGYDHGRAVAEDLSQLWL